MLALRGYLESGGFVHNLLYRTKYNLFVEVFIFGCAHRTYSQQNNEILSTFTTNRKSSTLREQQKKKADLEAKNSKNRSKIRNKKLTAAEAATPSIKSVLSAKRPRKEWFNTITLFVLEFYEYRNYSFFNQIIIQLIISLTFRSNHSS